MVVSNFLRGTSANYYLQQAGKQIFDIAENFIKNLPVRIRTDAAFRGHLLLLMRKPLQSRRLEKGDSARVPKIRKRWNGKRCWLRKTSSFPELCL